MHLTDQCRSIVRNESLHSTNASAADFESSFETAGIHNTFMNRVADGIKIMFFDLDLCNQFSLVTLRLIKKYLFDSSKQLRFDDVTY